jgi:beta-glucosidase
MNARTRPLVAALILILPAQPAALSQGVRTVDAAAERRIDSLLARMTLEEKIGQLNQTHVDWDEKAKQYVIPPERREELRKGLVGSLLNCVGARESREVQRVAVEESRLGIPLLFGLDVIHGFRTIFPIPLAMAASWDTNAVRHASRVAAVEATAAGIHWTFAPMVDIARDPRWGRIAEGFGEDPFLCSAMSAAAVRGFQGDRLRDASSLAACAKHFVAYGGAEGGRDYNTVDISERTLREVYLPSFRAAVDAGAATLMSAFNDLNGVPASSNPFTLTTILRKEWGFRGFVVSDWTAVGELIPHGIAADSAEAGSKALRAGVDMDMVSGIYNAKIPALVRSGRFPVDVVDESVRRVLRVKEALGLFDNPYRNCDTSRESRDVLNPESLASARMLASRSIVLLRNEGNLLPLSKSLRTLGVIGPLAESRHAPLGPWAGMGRSENVVTVLAGIHAAVAPGTRILYARGCDSTFTDSSGFAGAFNIARQSEVIVLVLGERNDMSGEAASRSEIGLPGVQRALIERVLAAGKPVVLVLLNGRPLTLAWESGHCPSILETWFPGVQAGNAIADVLFGTVNPSGKLPVTFPRSLGQIPIHYDAKNTGRPFSAADHFTSKYLDAPNTPLFPFGFGLSYTRFAYSNLVLSRSTLRRGDSLTVAVDVRNAGDRPGTEIVQLYLRDVAASVTRPVKQLKGFQRVMVNPGETRRVEFLLGPSSMTFPDAQWQPVIEPGAFKVFVGTSSADVLESEFYVE